MTERIFYDGDCAFCHAVVSFTIARDREAHFRFAPIESDLFRSLLPDSERARLPDSFVVQTEDGTLLVRSDATFHILERLGGIWRLLATIGRVFPKIVRNTAYDWIARNRKKLFGTTTEACPLVPPELRDRFELDGPTETRETASGRP